MQGLRLSSRSMYPYDESTDYSVALTLCSSLHTSQEAANTCKVDRAAFGVTHVLSFNVAGLHAQAV